MPRSSKGTVEELEELHAKKHPKFDQLLVSRAEETAGTLLRVGAGRQPQTFAKMVAWLAGLIGVSFLLGERRTLLEVDALAGTSPPRGPRDVPGVPIPPGVPFQFKEAIRSFILRDPRLADTMEGVTEVMRTRGFAAARSADVQITQRVQAEIAKGITIGAPAGTTAQRVQEVAGDVERWTLAYSQTVVQTNQTTAYTDGRFAQAERPVVRSIAPAFELVGPDFRDPDARVNHAAGVGLIADVQDPIWVEMKPPLGFNCRHGVSLVPRVELRRRGLLDGDGLVRRFLPPRFSEAGPDPGFR